MRVPERVGGLACICLGSAVTVLSSDGQIQVLKSIPRDLQQASPVAVASDRTDDRSDRGTSRIIPAHVGARMR